MGADKLAKNTPNATKFICPSPKVWDFDEKKTSLGVRSPWAKTCGCEQLTIAVFAHIKIGFLTTS